DLGGLVELARDRHALVGGIDPAAREDELSRHELVALMALAEQHLGHATGAVDQDQGRGVLRTDRLEREVAVDLVHAAHELVHPGNTVGGGLVMRGRFPPRAWDLREPRGRPAPVPLRLSERSSKRSAPATGAASTRRTVTGSPSR